MAWTAKTTATFDAGRSALNPAIQACIDKLLHRIIADPENMTDTRASGVRLCNRTDLAGGKLHYFRIFFRLRAAEAVVQFIGASAKETPGLH